MMGDMKLTDESQHGKIVDNILYKKVGLSGHPIWKIVALTTVVILVVMQWLTSSQLFPIDQQLKPDESLQTVYGDDSLALQGSRFKWDDITPSKDLSYVPCYDRFQCARLLLPMDWNETSSSNTVAIALIKLPANVSILDPRYGGEIYLNPGGPGGSGVQITLGRGQQIQTIVNSNDANGKVFDIVGFDPRGVAQSTPRVSCFSDLGARQFWSRVYWGDGLLGGPDSRLEIKWSRSKSFAHICADEGGETPPINYHISTANVARDMVEILEKLGQLREKNVLKAMEAYQPYQTSPETLNELKYKPGSERLQYWGFSYGTLLGMTFSTMYPSRVKRMIADGVGDMTDYTSGEWKKFLTRTQESFEYFFKSCYNAGPEACALYDAAGPLAIEKSVNSTLKDIAELPISIWQQGQESPQILTHSDVVNEIIHTLYVPYRGYPTLARFLANIRDRNVTAIVQDLDEDKVNCSDKACLFEECLERMDWWVEANIAITCSDGEDRRLETLQNLKDHMKELKEQTELFSGMATEVRLQCINWKTRPKWRFTGPFEANTSHPMLFIGNRLDPVAPLDNAISMSKNFDGSRVLAQDTVGHCSVAAPSLCTATHIRNYFQTGELPPPGTVCSADRTPFDDPVQGTSNADTHLLQALEDLLDLSFHAPLRKQGWSK